MPKSQGRTSLAYLEPRKPWGWSWWKTERGSERKAGALWTLVKNLDTLRAFPAGERHNLTYRLSGARAEAGKSVGRLLTWYSPQVEVAQAQSSSRSGYEKKWLLVCFLLCVFPTNLIVFCTEWFYSTAHCLQEKPHQSHGTAGEIWGFNPSYNRGRKLFQLVTKHSLSYSFFPFLPPIFCPLRVLFI